MAAFVRTIAIHKPSQEQYQAHENLLENGFSLPNVIVAVENVVVLSTGSKLIIIANPGRSFDP